MRLRRLALAAVVLAGASTACTDDDASPASTTAPITTTTTTTTTTSDPATPTTVPNDPALTPQLLTADDLPDGFEPNADVDDTITAFCAGQDAAAGLQASGRAIAGFRRTPAGASVIELIFRFEADGAARFVTQADDLLTGCSEVPDATGLAFTYEPVSAELEAALVGADASASRYGVSFGSGNLTVDVAVVQRGDLGVLVAVLGLELPRAELDALAAAAFTAALDKLG